jgi:hypothetical protein
MANMNNEQRKAFADIVEANGRAHEFYQKYGQSAVAKNRVKAQAILDKMIAIDEKADALEAVCKEAVNALEAKNRKAVEAVKRSGKGLADELDKLGYDKSSDGYGSDREIVLFEDTSRTSAEYEMFKKRTMASIWGASTLEEGNKAIQDYLNLVK